jgi:hypothetical protein
VNDFLRNVLERLRAFHREESGAVIMMCLAAFMILVMVSLVMYDAGQVSFNKVNAQTGADVAGYSQAATKARSMNMIAFGNISKRSLVGLHNMYWAMYETWIAWTASRCSTCGFWHPIACAECVYNGVMIVIEGLMDWFYFNGLPIIPKILPMLYSASTLAFEAQVSQINWWQIYMTDFTPWWAWAEASVRGMRNGASLIGTYPPLATPLTVVTDWVDMAVTAFGGTPSGGTSWLYDQLPIANWDKIIAFPSQNASSVWKPFVLGFYNPHAGCLAPTWGFNVVTPTSFIEYMMNWVHHKNRSDGGFGPVDGPADAAAGWGFGAQILGGFCLLRVNAISTPSLWMNMGPFNLRADTNSPRHMSMKSNIVFSYKHSPDVKNVLRENFNIIGQQYANNGRSAVEESSGSWALSRSEIVFPEGLKPRGSPNIGMHDTWMWHTGWTGKLRPVALPGEQTALNYDLENMLVDVSPFLWLSRNTLGFLSSPGFDGNAADADVAALQKALFAMDEPSLDGLSK